MAFRQSGRLPDVFPSRLFLPSMFMTLTETTFTLKSCSTALAISILFAVLATSKTYWFLVVLHEGVFSVTMGLTIDVILVHDDNASSILAKASTVTTN